MESGKGRVLGLGGLFIASPDPGATLEWYQKVLGMQPGEFGGYEFLHRECASVFPRGARTVFTAFDANSDYLRPSGLPFMFNLIVDDLQAILARARAEGAKEVQPQESTDYGDFAWLMDPDGRKIELWEPAPESDAVNGLSA